MSPRSSACCLDIGLRHILATSLGSKAIKQDISMRCFDQLAEVLYQLPQQRDKIFLVSVDHVCCCCLMSDRGPYGRIAIWLNVFTLLKYCKIEIKK